MTLLRSSAKYDQAVETQIMTGKITSHSEGEGPCILTGVVQAGRAGKDASWCIRDTAQVQVSIILSLEDNLADADGSFSIYFVLQ